MWGIKPHYKQPLQSHDQSTIPISWFFKPPNPFAHNNAWSDYVCTDIKCISHLPLNIPLEYGGLFGTDLLMLFDGFGRQNWIRTMHKVKNKKVLILGSGRQSLINMLIPLLQICDSGDIVVVSSHKRHNKVLKHFNVKSVIDQSNFDPSKHKGKYDIVIDSLSIKAEQVQKNVGLIKPDQSGTEYWVIRNPLNDVLLNAQNRIEGMYDS